MHRRYCLFFILHCSILVRYLMQTQLTSFFSDQSWDLIYTKLILSDRSITFFIDFGRLDIACMKDQKKSLCSRAF